MVESTLQACSFVVKECWILAFWYCILGDLCVLFNNTIPDSLAAFWRGQPLHGGRGEWKMRAGCSLRPSTNGSIFTALHGMQTRSSDENSVCLSVRLSVCPSVRQTRAL